MKKVKLFADSRMIAGTVEAGVFGSFIEHLGRAVYGGLYEPGHPTADADGFRGDVLALIRELDVPVVRYPGGNFLSGYDWRDGIGPADKRPTRLDLAWKTVESNRFGTDEFMKWCAKADIQPMLGVNLGTGTPAGAAQLVEYCNLAGGTELSELRKANGGNAPYAVKYWCLGNEMDGEWQIGHLNAADYAKKARTAAHLMKSVDPTIKLIACGSSNQDMPSYPEWDMTVMDGLYDVADYISMHQYYNGADKIEDAFGAADHMSRFIATVRATADYVAAKRRSKKRMCISFDEWNVWYTDKPSPSEWQYTPPHLFEDDYTLKDALVFGGLVNTLINNSDRVKLACLAQLVNTIAPISTQDGGTAIKQTIYYPFLYASRYGRGNALATVSDAPVFATKYGDASILNHAVVARPDGGVSVFLCNYTGEPIETALELRTPGELTAVAHVEMSGNDPYAGNTFARPEAVVPHDAPIPTVKDGRTSVSLPPLSWHMLRFDRK